MVDYDGLAEVLRNGPPRPIAPFECEGGKDGKRKRSVCHGGVTDPHHVCVATVYGRTEDEAEDFAAAISAAYNAAEELVALRSIIAGRTTPPTEAERETHSAAGGAWLVRRAGRFGCGGCVRVVRGLALWGDLRCARRSRPPLRVAGGLIGRARARGGRKSTGA